MIDPERHAQVKALFAEVCDLDPEPRATRLDEACGDDDTLRAEVEALLDFEERRATFLAHPESPLAALAALPHDVPPAPDTTSPPDAPLPHTIGGFRVRSCLGAGGMGTVYEVEQQRPHRTVALKLLHPGLAPTVALQRFEREGEILGRLQHPGIARIYEIGRVDTDVGPHPYLTMELVRGEPITRHAREQRLPTSERLGLFARVCDAVQHAHEQGVVHRDLKPANILVDASGQPKVLDFGIARVTDGDVQLKTMQTSVGEIMGTLAYMSPEQAEGDPSAIDERCDVYALGVLLYELLSGELPYDVAGAPLPQALEAIRSAEPRRLSTLHRRLGGDVETVVGKALEKDRARRYASAAALAADVRHILAEEPIEARPPSRLYLARKFVRRHRTLVTATSAVILALVAALAVALRYGASEADARHEADRAGAAARAESYASGLLAAQLMTGRPGEGRLARQLESLPEEQRGWEWGVLTRQVDRTVASLEAPGVRLAAYRDGEHVLHVDGSGAVAVWDVVTGDDAPLGTPEPGARPLALSVDARWLLSYRDGALLFSDLTALASDTGGDELGSAERVRVAPLEPPGVVPLPGCEPAERWPCAALDADGQRAAVFTEDGAVALVERLPRPAVTPLEGSQDHVNLLRFSPDGALLAVAGAGRIRVIDVATRSEAWSRTRGSSRFDSVAFDPARDRVAFGVALDVEHRAAAGGELLETWDQQRLGSVRLGSPFRLDLDPSGRHLAALFRGGWLHLLDAGTGDVQASAHHGVGWMATDVAWSPDGASVLTAGGDAGTLRLWNGELRPCDVLGPAGASLNGMALSPDGSRVAAGGWDRVLRVWDVASGVEQLAIPCGGTVFSAAFSPDAARIAAARGSVGLGVWDARTGERVLQARDEPARRVTATPDGSAWVVAGRKGRLRSLDASTLAERFVVELDGSDVQAVVCSPDGRWIAASTAGGTISLRDAASGAELTTVLGPKGGPKSWQGTLALAFSPDGRWLASGSGTGGLTLRALPSLEIERAFLGHRNEVFSVAFTPDGRRLLSGGRDGTLRVWNPDTGGQLAGFDGDGSYLWALGVSPDGRRVATTSGDGALSLWDAAPVSVGWIERRAALRAAGVAAK